jgi:radical SAM superfamily enzyme YgiQ (UPF0313 family)
MPEKAMRAVLVANLNLSGLQARDSEPALDSLVPPLGLLSLAAVLEANSHQPIVFDPNYEIESGTLALGDRFIGDMVDAVLAEKPDVVGFSTMCNSFHITLRSAERLKWLRPDLPIVLGGPQVSFVDRETLETFQFIDFVLRGEAEKSLPGFIAALEHFGSYVAIPGLTYRRGNQVIQNEAPEPVDDLDQLPFPAWHLFKYDVRGAYSIDVGRGCPFACKFCSTSSFFQRRFRLKSFNRLIDEIRWLQRTYGAEAITLIHDLFTANRRWVRALCERLLLEKDLRFAWSASARIDTVDESLLQLMGQAGCKALFYGAETGSPRLQRDAGKRLKVDSIVPVTAATIDAGINPTLSFIAGFPTETIDDLQATFRVIDQLLEFPEANVQLHLMSPQLGTPDLVEFAHALRLDGYFSDIANGSRSFLEPEWFLRYPNLFPSFYFYENAELGRDLLQGADQFVRLPAANMRYTIRRLRSSGHSLWEVYRAWKEWGRRIGRIDTRAGSQYSSMLTEAFTEPRSAKPESTPDECLLDFADFARDFCVNQGIEIGNGEARDEIIAFYLRHYHHINVRTAKQTGRTVAAVESL